MVKGARKSKKEVYYVLGQNKFQVQFSSDGTVKVNRKKIDVEIAKEDQDCYIISKDRKRFHAELVNKNQNKYTVQINGNTYDFSIETPISYKRKKLLERNRPDDKNASIIAPMPGKIVEFFVEEGTVVKKGDALFILEAMKMKNEIIAEETGTVKKINFKPEAAVMKDDVIIEVDKV